MRTHVSGRALRRPWGTGDGGRGGGERNLLRCLLLGSFLSEGLVREANDYIWIRIL